MDCSVYCTAVSYDIKKIYEFLKLHYECTYFREVLYVKYPPLLKEDPPIEIYYFPYGVAVCWSVGLKEGLQLVNNLIDFQDTPLEVIENDKFKYAYGEKAKFDDDGVVLSNHHADTKLAISHGMAQSVKLGAFEYIIRQTFAYTKHIPENLSQKGKINLSRKQIRQEMGNLFITRSSINLHADVLDTPEFFWDHPDLEKYYLMAVNYLDVQTRSQMLNHRLDVLKELFEMLSNELNHQHSSRLEWIIIWLIMIEVTISLVKEFL